MEIDMKITKSFLLENIDDGLSKATEIIPQIYSKWTSLGKMKNQKGQDLEFYEHPTKGDSSDILVRFENWIAHTGFFDMGDFFPDSDYMPIFIPEKEGFMCAFDVE